jgi:glucose-6-phosphate 1-dehydrogenase
MSKNGSPRPENHVIVLFGATGDLARRKLLPGLFHLHAAGLLPREYRIIGSSPPANALTDWQFRERAEQACADFGVTKPGDPSWPSFAERLSFGAAEPGNTADLEAAIQRAEKEIGGPAAAVRVVQPCTRCVLPRPQLPTRTASRPVS